MRCASIDVGTNAVLLLVMESNGRLEELHDAATITRLGEGLLATGRLIRPAMERTVGALEGYRRILDEYGVETVDCFGTAPSARPKTGTNSWRWRGSGPASG